MIKFLMFITERSSLNRVEVLGLISFMVYLNSPSRELHAGWVILIYFVSIAFTTCLEAKLHPEHDKS